MKELLSLAHKDLTGLRVLVRVDFNIENAEESFRLEATYPTLEWLIEKKCKVIIASHRGRPKGVEKRYSLKMIVPILEKKLRRKITFVKNIIDSKLHDTIDAALPGSVFLLENLRFLKAEENEEVGLAHLLASLGDIYVNDAFSVCHRKNASVTLVPHFLPSYAGFQLEKEVKCLSKVMENPKKPLVVILGGAKVSDKLGVIEHLMHTADTFLIGGASANTLLKAKGENIRDSHYEANMLHVGKKLAIHPKVKLPTDFVWSKNKMLDIGPKTIHEFKEVIEKAHTVIWNGPMGLFENPRFAHGSNAIAHAIAHIRALTVVGGGETTQLIQSQGLERRIDFLSTGGGAMLQFLAGKELPGLTALEKAELHLAPHHHEIARSHNLLSR